MIKKASELKYPVNVIGEILDFVIFPDIEIDARFFFPSEMDYYNESKAKRAAKIARIIGKLNSSKDLKANFEYVISTELTAYEADIIRKYHKDGFSKLEIGKLYNISPANVRQILVGTWRKLGNRERLKKIIYGIDWYYQNKMKAACETKYKEGYNKGYSDGFRESNSTELEITSESVVSQLQDFSLEELNLTTRTYNCLKRAGINSLKELIARKPEEINLAKKCYDEVMNVIFTHGMDVHEYQTVLEKRL